MLRRLSNSVVKFVLYIITKQAIIALKESEQVDTNPQQDILALSLFLHHQYT